jgi:hypothetical protein
MNSNAATVEQLRGSRGKPDLTMFESRIADRAKADMVLVAASESEVALHREMADATRQLQETEHKVWDAMTRLFDWSTAENGQHLGAATGLALGFENGTPCPSLPRSACSVWACSASRGCGGTANCVLIGTGYTQRPRPSDSTPYWRSISSIRDRTPRRGAGASARLR